MERMHTRIKTIRAKLDIAQSCTRTEEDLCDSYPFDSDSLETHYRIAKHSQCRMTIAKFLFENRNDPALYVRVSLSRSFVLVTFQPEICLQTQTTFDYSVLSGPSLTTSPRVFSRRFGSNLHWKRPSTLPSSLADRLHDVRRTTCPRYGTCWYAKVLRDGLESRLSSSGVLSVGSINPNPPNILICQGRAHLSRHYNTRQTSRFSELS